MLPAPLLALFCQGDVDGRIIFDGFATAKNFSDWILNFSGHSRQVKMKAKKNGCILLMNRDLQEPSFFTSCGRFVKRDCLEACGLRLSGTKLGRLAVLNRGRKALVLTVGKV